LRNSPPNLILLLINLKSNFPKNILPLIRRFPSDFALAKTLAFAEIRQIS
jgi:hypothetical protein